LKVLATYTEEFSAFCRLPQACGFPYSALL
jgi:hypothetical protein